MEGLTSPRKSKRKSSKSTTSAKRDTTVKTPAAVNGSSAGVVSEVGTPSVVDEPGAEVAVEGEAVSIPAIVDKPSNDAAAKDRSASTPVVIDRHGTDVAKEDTAVGTLLGNFESVSREVMTNALQSSDQSTLPRPWMPGSITDDSSPESSSTIENAQIGVQPSPLLSCPRPTMADLLNPENAIRVATSVPLELVNQRDKIGQFGGPPKRQQAQQTLPRFVHLRLELATTVKATSFKSPSSLFNDLANTEQCWNKSIFMSLVPSGDKRLAVCPIIPVFPGDFLGIYSGTFRFSENISLSQAIPGPKEMLWSDYSQVIGTLNQRQVSKPDDDAFYLTSSCSIKMLYAVSHGIELSIWLWAFCTLAYVRVTSIYYPV